MSEGFLEGTPPGGQLAHAGVCCHQRTLALGAFDDGREGVRRLVAQRRDINYVDRKRFRAQIAFFQQRVGPTEGEDRRVAIVRGDQHRGPGRSPSVAHGPAGRDALLQQVAKQRLGARILAKLHERAHVKPQPRHRHRSIDGTAPYVCGNLERLGLAAFFEQQEGVVGVGHTHALDAIAGDDGDRINHGAADGEGLHVRLTGSRACANATPWNSSSSSVSHKRMPPVMPAVLLTIRTCAGASSVSLRALPPPT